MVSPLSAYSAGQSIPGGAGTIAALRKELTENCFPLAAVPGERCLVVVPSERSDEGPAFDSRLPQVRDPSALELPRDDSALSS